MRRVQHHNGYDADSAVDGYGRGLVNHPIKALIVAVTASAILFFSPHARANESLPIPPVVQQTQLWCWAAVLEMVLKHYGYGSVNPGGNYQCGIVAMLGGDCYFDCRHCVTTIGTLHNLGAVLSAYGATTLSIDVHGEPVSYHLRQRLNVEQIAKEINDGDPIIVGISPSGMARFYPPGFGEHLAVITGYRFVDGKFSVFVNDPYPYSAVGRDPYINAGAEMLEPGRYLIRFTTFVQILGYKDSVIFHAQR